MTRRAWILMWALALLWGASYLFIKVALEDMEPLFIVWLRLALAALVLMPVAIRARALAGMRQRLGGVALLAMVQIVVPFLLITFGERDIASGLTGILIASAPIFTALLGMAGFGERIGGWRLAGVLVGIVGVVLLFGVDLSGDSATLVAGLMIVTAALGYAVGAIFLREKLSELESVGVAATATTLSALITLPGGVAHLPDAMPSLAATASILALGVGGTGIAFAIYYRLITDVGAHRTAVVAYLAPGFALLYGAVLLGEEVTLGAAGGLALILAGSWAAAEGRPPWQRRERVSAVAPAAG